MKLAHQFSIILRLAFVVLFLIAFHLLLIAPALAATSACTQPTPGPNFGEQAINQLNLCAIQTKKYDDKIFNLNQISGTTDSLYVLLTGNSLLHPETDSVTRNRGALNLSGSMVAMLYSAPPASGVEYLAQKIQRFNPVQPAYAQSQEGGIGFGALKPVQGLWTAFRNISYVGFTIVFVVIGFMIMFRTRISSQAVATIQDSLPRIVIALILVTFSYAIAGLMIDIMFVVLNIIIQALAAAKPPLLDTGKSNVVFENNIFFVAAKIFFPTIKTVAEAIADTLDKVINAGALGDIVGWFFGTLGGIIAGVTVLVITFRIFIMLLMSYVTIILLTIFAPFLFLWSSLPGQSGVKDWFKQLAANLAVFVTVALMIIFGGILAGLNQLGAPPNESKLDPKNVGQFPLLSGNLSTDSLSALIGIGFLMMAPSAAKIVKERIGVKEGAFGAGVGAAMAGLGVGAAASRNIGRFGAENVPGVRGITERIAAFRELPKERRQAAIERFGAKHAGRQSGFYIPPKQQTEQPKS